MEQCFHEFIIIAVAPVNANVRTGTAREPTRCRAIIEETSEGLSMVDATRARWRVGSWGRWGGAQGGAEVEWSGSGSGTSLIGVGDDSCGRESLEGAGDGKGLVGGNVDVVDVDVEGGAVV